MAEQAKNERKTKIEIQFAEFRTNAPLEKVTKVITCIDNIAPIIKIKVVAI